MVFSSNELDILFLQNGKDGISADSKYIWVKYSQNSNGSPMTDSSEGAQYIGIAYNKDTSTESTDPTDYEWTRIKGKDGLDGLTIVLSNESQSIATSNNLMPLEAKTYECTVSVYKGVDSLSATSGAPEDTEFSVSLPSNPPGMTLTQSTAGTILFTVTTSQAIASSGNIDLLITIGGVDTPITRSISYSSSVQGDSGLSATNVILSNENHSFTATSDGHAVASSINVGISAYYGSIQIPATIGEITGVPSGMSISINNNDSTSTSLEVSITGNLTTLNGVINIPVTANGISFVKQFTYVLSMAGSDGSDGTDSTSYWLIVDAAAIVKNVSGGYSPSSITFSAKKQTGNGPVLNYEGRFRIFLNGSDTPSYTSATDESSKQFSIPSDTSSIQCVMYEAGGTSVILDEQMIPIVSDGENGEDGSDAILLQIISSNGNMFKNSSLATTLTVTIIVGNHTITSSQQMHDFFGNNAFLEWSEKGINDDDFSTLSADDSRLSDNGFILTLNPQDVTTQAVFNCKLNF